MILITRGCSDGQENEKAAAARRAGIFRATLESPNNVAARARRRHSRGRRGRACPWRCRCSRTPFLSCSVCSTRRDRTPQPWTALPERRRCQERFRRSPRAKRASLRVPPCRRWLDAVKESRRGLSGNTIVWKYQRTGIDGGSAPRGRWTKAANMERRVLGRQEAGQGTYAPTSGTAVSVRLKARPRNIERPGSLRSGPGLHFWCGWLDGLWTAQIEMNACV